MTESKKKEYSLEKQLIVKQLSDKLERSNYIFFAKFKGISVNDMNDLRCRLKKAADDAVVVKNRVVQIILKRMSLEDAVPFLEGSVLLTTGKNEPQVVSKILVDFAKEKENFELRGLFFNQSIFQKQYIQDLAKLPSRQQLLASVVGGMNAPISGFVNGLGQLLRSLVNVLDQIQKQKN